MKRMKYHTVEKPVLPNSHKGTNEVVNFISGRFSAHLEGKNRTHTEVYQNDLSHPGRHEVCAYTSYTVEGQKDKRTVRNFHTVGEFFLEPDGTIRIRKNLTMDNGQAPYFKDWHTVETAEELAFVPHF